MKSASALILQLQSLGNENKCMLFISHSVSVFVVVMAARINIVLIIQEGMKMLEFITYIDARWHDCPNVLEHSIGIPVHPGESQTMSRESWHLQGDLNEK